MHTVWQIIFINYEQSELNQKSICPEGMKICVSKIYGQTSWSSKF